MFKDPDHDNIINYRIGDRIGRLIFYGKSKGRIADINIRIDDRCDRIGTADYVIIGPCEISIVRT